MANNVLVSELPKSIQEMSMNGDEPPSEYLVKGKSFGSKEESSTLIPIPIIDVSLLSSQGELEKLRSALSSVGCFQAIGHGMPTTYLDKVREVATHFFALPVEEKQKYARDVNEYEGYGNDIIFSEKQVHDWCYRLALTVFPEEKRRLFLWPESPNDFRETLEGFSTKVNSIMVYLLRSMARSLHLEESSFLNQFGNKSLLKARFNFYPSCSRPDLILGIKAHTDKSGITVVLQDKEVEGLQVLRDHKWINVPTIPDALVVNLGDQLQIMSNGIFKSPMHRVVTNTKKLRMSLVIFNEPEPENEIGPVEDLIDETHPRLYKNVKNYREMNYKSYHEGKIALDSVKLQITMIRSETISYIVRWFSDDWR